MCIRNQHFNMATAQPIDIDNLLQCPVCFDSYTDPRSLQCAHQFCLRCLERLVTKKPAAQDKITCPTCRRDTPINRGEEAKDLPRPVLMNEVQTLLKNLQVSSKKGHKSQCDLCETEDNLATSYCYQCQISMCDSCQSDHEKEARFKGHKTVFISDSLFCQPHENVVTEFCHNCDCGICPKCAAKEHRKHKTENIVEMAGKSRIKVSDLISTQKSTAISKTTPQQIKKKVQELTQSKTSIVSQLDRIIDSLGMLKSKLESSRDEVTAKTSADIKALKLYEADLDDLSASRTSFIEYGQYLLEKASDPELVYNANKLRETTRDTTQPPTVHRPAGNKLGQLETDISKWIRECNIEYERDSFPSSTSEITCDHLIAVGPKGSPPLGPHPSPTTSSTPQPPLPSPHSHSSPAIPSTPQPDMLTAPSRHRQPPLPTIFILPRAKRPASAMTLKQTIDSNDVVDVAFNTKLSQLAVRTRDRNSPIQIYTLSGTLVKGIGRGAWRLAGEGGLGIDTRRDLYLAPCGDHLHTIDMEGKVNKVIKVKGSSLRGVAYCGTSDQYIVTDIRKRRVVVINARIRMVVNSFGSKGSGNNKFFCPFHVCVGDISGRATIVVSDPGNRAVKLFELRGAHVETYWIADDCYVINYPQGVAVDPAGRVIVCNQDNRRVVMAWKNTLNWGVDSVLCNDENSHYVVPSKKHELGGYHGALDFDPVSKLLAIVTPSGLQLYTFG